MAVARIKLLRNKRQVVVKQMRRDIALLLQSGQDATARIRVFHFLSCLKDQSSLPFFYCLKKRPKLFTFFLLSEKKTKALDFNGNSG